MSGAKRSTATNRIDEQDGGPCHQAPGSQGSGVLSGAAGGQPWLGVRLEPITVIGAGIAGLAVSLALARAGHPVRVLEQASGLAEGGAGLQISPNGASVLKALGLGDAIERIAQPTEAVDLRRAQAGRLVLRMKLGPGFWLVHRADLIESLQQAARATGVEIVFGQRIEAALPPGIVLGADGLHSTLRSRLNGPEQPFFTGQVAWRAVVPSDGGAAVAQVFMGPGRHLVSYPLRNGTLRNIVAVEERAEWVAEGWSGPGDISALRSAFSDFAGPVQQWLDQIGEVNLWGLFRHQVAPVWAAEGIAILGDAAHPMLPFLAQGANMALEDAWVLARCLSEGRLAAYQPLREARVRRVVAAANANARAYHLRGPLARTVHLGLQAVGAVAPGLMLQRYDWVYGEDVTRL